MNMTQQEKEYLVESVTNLALRDVLQREDMVEILRICQEACDRRISVIEDVTKQGGAVQ